MVDRRTTDTSRNVHPQPPCEPIVDEFARVHPGGAEPSRPSGGTLWKPEWWEKLRGRRVSWAQRHTALVKRLLIAWLALLAVAVVWLVVATLFVDAAKPAMLSVWFGVVWVCVLWFLLLRTKTLTFAGYLRMFVVCVLWSIFIGIVLRTTAIEVSPIAHETGFGPRVALASIGEESLKLMPLVVVVLAAPGRVRRFSVADWTLLALASGGGFLAAEEILRRLYIYAPQVSIFGDRYNLDGVVKFGLFGLDDPGVSQLFWWPGHHVVTMLVGASIGFAVALWRSRRGGRVSSRVGAGAAAVLLVAAAFWSAVTTHAYYNLEAGGSSPDVLPAPLRWWHVITSDHVGGTWMLALMVLAIWVVDASRLRRSGSWQIPVGAPGWAVSLDDQLTRHRPPADTNPMFVLLGKSAIEASRSLLFVVVDTVRGVGFFLAADARQPDEPWWAGPRRAQASVVMLRESREVAFHVDSPPPSPWLARALGVAAAIVLLWLTFSVAPEWVRQLDDTSWLERRGESWLAQLFDGLGRWWNDLSGWQKFLVIGAVTALPALTFGLATTTALAGLSAGSAAWTTFDKADETADFLGDPAGAVRRYWSNATVGSFAADVTVLAMSAWLPGKVIRHVAPHARRVPGLVSDYMDDPRAYREAQRAWRDSKLGKLRHEGGHVTYGHADGLARVNGRRPINYRWANRTYGGPDWDPRQARNWTKELHEKYPAGVKFTSEGFPDFRPYARGTVTLKRMTGDYRLDAKHANALYRAADAPHGLPKVPRGWVWHHVEDATTMQLVPEDIHRAVRHTGGVAVMKLPK